MDDLFAYGSLMCEDIMRSVTGVELQHAQGVLQGYQRLELKNEHYPAIIENNGSEIDGVVYFGIPEKSMEKLDSFEGEMYQRRTIEVQLVGGNIIKVSAYVFKDEYHDRLCSKEWDFARFLDRGKEAFVGNYFGYDEI
jgi:gamma-glutamylcyclotransferase (GGCT)/AIG2-like uncharacterized protein YtfP